MIVQTEGRAEWGRKDESRLEWMIDTLLPSYKCSVKLSAKGFEILLLSIRIMGNFAPLEILLVLRVSSFSTP